jgi:lysophospholipase L1-like esterase
MGTEITLTGSAAATPFQAGRLDLSGVWLPPTSTDAASDIDLFNATTTDGTARLSYEASTQRFRVFVRGVNVLNTSTFAANLPGMTMQNWQAGDSVEWRVWYYPGVATRGAGFRLSVNGCGGVDTVASATGSALNPATRLDIAARVEAWGAFTCGTLTDELAGTPTGSNQPCWGLMIGDSIVAPYAGPFLPALGALVVSNDERRGRRINSQAQSGGTIDGFGGRVSQTAQFEGDAQFGAGRLRWASIQCGINNILLDATSDQVIDALRVLVSKLRVHNRRAKILLSTITPGRGNFTGARYIVWLAVNAAITAGKIDCDAIVDTVTPLSDGTDTLKAEYRMTDFIHPNLAGRQANAAAIHAALNRLGILG